MTYKLKFLPIALKEWQKLDATVQRRFKKKLAQRLEQPHNAKSKLSGFKNHYKIKLQSSGYRLVYEVIDKDIVVLVIAIGKRDRNKVYKKSRKKNLK